MPTDPLEFQSEVRATLVKEEIDFARLLFLVFYVNAPLTPVESAGEALPLYRLLLFHLENPRDSSPTVVPMLLMALVSLLWSIQFELEPEAGDVKLQQWTEVRTALTDFKMALQVDLDRMEKLIDELQKQQGHNNIYQASTSQAGQDFPAERPIVENNKVYTPHRYDCCAILQLLVGLLERDAPEGPGQLLNTNIRPNWIDKAIGQAPVPHGRLYKPPYANRTVLRSLRRLAKYSPALQDSAVPELHNSALFMRDLLKRIAFKLVETKTNEASLFEEWSELEPPYGEPQVETHVALWEESGKESSEPFLDFMRLVTELHKPMLDPEDDEGMNLDVFWDESQPYYRWLTCLDSNNPEMFKRCCGNSYHYYVSHYELLSSISGGLCSEKAYSHISEKTLADLPENIKAITQQLFEPHGKIWDYEEWALMAGFRLVRRLITVPPGRDSAQFGVDENRSQLADRGILPAILALVLSGHELVSIELKAAMLRTLASFAHSDQTCEHFWHYVFGDDFGVQPAPNPGMDQRANVVGSMVQVDPIISDLQQSYIDTPTPQAPNRRGCFVRAFLRLLEVMITKAPAVGGATIWRYVSIMIKGGYTDGQTLIPALQLWPLPVQQDMIAQRQRWQVSRRIMSIFVNLIQNLHPIDLERPDEMQVPFVKHASELMRELCCGSGSLVHASSQSLLGQLFLVLEAGLHPAPYADAKTDRHRTDCITSALELLLLLLQKSPGWTEAQLRKEAQMRIRNGLGYGNVGQEWVTGGYKAHHAVYELIGKNREGQDRVSIIAQYVGGYSSSAGTLGSVARQHEEIHAKLSVEIIRALVPRIPDLSHQLCDNMHGEVSWRAHFAMFFAERLVAGSTCLGSTDLYAHHVDVPVNVAIIRMLCVSLKAPSVRGETLAHALLGFKGGGLTGRAADYPDPRLLGVESCLDVILRRMRSEFFVQSEPLFAEEAYRLLYLCCSDRSTYVPTLSKLSDPYGHGGLSFILQHLQEGVRTHPLWCGCPGVVIGAQAWFLRIVAMDIRVSLHGDNAGNVARLRHAKEVLNCLWQPPQGGGPCLMLRLLSEMDLTDPDPRVQELLLNVPLPPRNESEEYWVDRTRELEARKQFLRQSEDDAKLLYDVKALAEWLAHDDPRFDRLNEESKSRYVEAAVAFNRDRGLYERKLLHRENLFSAWRQVLEISLAEPASLKHILMGEGIELVRRPGDLTRGVDALFAILGGPKTGLLMKFQCPGANGEEGTVEARVRPHLSKAVHIVLMHLVKHTGGTDLARTHATLQTHTVQCEQIAAALIGAILQRGKAGTLQESKSSSHELTRRNLYAAFVSLSRLTGYTTAQMPLLRELEETNLLHEAGESEEDITLAQVKTAREALKQAVQGTIGHRTTELARAMAHDVLHGHDYVYRTIAAQAMAALMEEPEHAAVMRADPALRGLPQRLLGALREAPCLSRDQGHPLSPFPSPESQRFTVFYSSVFAILISMANTKGGAADIVRENTLNELTHFGFLHPQEVPQLRNFNMGIPESRIRFSQLLHPVLTFLSTVLTQTVGQIGDGRGHHDQPLIGRHVLSVLEGPPAESGHARQSSGHTMLHALSASAVEGDNEEVIDVALDELHLLTTITCRLAACGVLVDDDTLHGRTEMVQLLKQRMLDLQMDIQRLAHADRPPQSLLGSILVKIPFGGTDGLGANENILAIPGHEGRGMEDAHDEPHKGIPATRRLLALRIAANLTSFQTHLMARPGYWNAKNVLAPYYYREGQTEFSHANELLLFARWSLNLFNQHESGSSGDHEAHQELRRKIKEGSTVQDLYSVPMEIWTKRLLHVEREMSALAYCVETSMTMALRMFKDCKDTPNLLMPEARDVQERTMMINRAERTTNEIKESWNPSTMDSNFFLNVDNEFKAAFGGLRKRWRLSDATRQASADGRINLHGELN